MSSRVVNFILKGESHMAIVQSTEAEFTYEDYLDAISKTAGPDECYYFMNEDGSLIPPEIFIPYVNQNYLRQNDKVYVGVINSAIDETEVELEDNVFVNEVNAINITPNFIASNNTNLENRTPHSTNNLQINTEQLDKESQLDITDLQRYIIENSGEHLLKKYRENSLLSDPNRKALVAIIVKKLTNQCSYWPTTSQKIKYAKLAVELFPTYKTTSENYYELFYDPVRQKGFINSRLKTVQKNVRDTTGQRKQKKKRSESTSSETTKELCLSENVDVDTLKTQYNDDIEFLNNCPNTEISAILGRMKQTYPMRKAIISSNEKFNLWNIFPCYFTTPDIILQDYEIRTGCTKTNSKVAEFIPQIFAKYSTLKTKTAKETEGVDYEWDSFTNAMLTLVKLLPSFRRSVSKRQKTTNIQTKGDNVFEKLIVFVKSNNDIEQTKTISVSPVLIAVGPVKKTILQYFLKVDSQLLPTKKNCTSIEAFDCLYKAHVVLNYDYDWELKTFFDFIQYFVYEDKEGINLTTRQKEIWKLISV